MKTIDVEETFLRYLMDKAGTMFCLQRFYWFLSEMDLMQITKSSLYINEFEIKVSRSDFNKEFKSKKAKHQNLMMRCGNIPNRFSFVCPSGLIKKEDLPIYAGLYYISDDYRVLEIKRPPLLHRKKIGVKTYETILNKVKYRLHKGFIGKPSNYAISQYLLENGFTVHKDGHLSKKYVNESLMISIDYRCNTYFIEKTDIVLDNIYQIDQYIYLLKKQ